MQTQQVFGVSGGGMFYPAKSVNAKSGDGSFDQLIQMSQNAGAANEQVTKPAETKTESAADVTTAEQPEESGEVSTEMKDTTATAEEKTELKAEGKTEPTDVEAAERVAAVLTQVTEVIQEVLGLTEEELNQFMEELGISNIDLIQPETLQTLVLKANSEQDAVVLLTDAKLLDTVNELAVQVENVLQEAGITPEELVLAMENPEFDALVEEAMAAITVAETEEPVEKTETKEEVEEESTIVEKGSDTTKEVSDAPVKVEIQTEGKESEHPSHEKGREDSMEADNFSGQFVQGLQKAAEEISEITGQKDMVQVIREIADQILEKVKVSVTAETTSLEIVLTPEELGRVNLTVSAERDGTMKATFVTENELAKEAIERNLVQFKETLQEQGLKVDNIEVTVGNFEFDKNGQAGESSQEEQKNGNRRFLSDEELGQKDDNDQLAKVFLEGGESTVNYMA